MKEIPMCVVIIDCEQFSAFPFITDNLVLMDPVVSWSDRLVRKLKPKFASSSERTFDSQIASQ